MPKELNHDFSSLSGCFAHAIRQTRLARKIEFSQAVEDSEVPLSTINDWERGRGLSTLDRLNRLAEAYGVKLSEVVQEAESWIQRQGPGDWQPGKIVDRYVRVPREYLEQLVQLHQETRNELKRYLK